MARPIIHLRREVEKENRQIESKVDAPQRALDALVRTIDGMALDDDCLAIEGQVYSNGVAHVAIVDSDGFPLLELHLRGES